MELKKKKKKKFKLGPGVGKRKPGRWDGTVTYGSAALAITK